VRPDPRCEEFTLADFTPVYVIGAGPAGLSAALALSRSGIPVQLIERSDLFGGKVNSRHSSGHSLEHGVHGWWVNYLNFDRLLRWSDVDPEQVLKEADGSALIMPDGKVYELRLLPWNVPSPLFFMLQMLKAPYLTMWDFFRVASFAVHALAFSHQQDYPDYDNFSFQQLLDFCGVSPRVQKYLLESFILSFDFTTGARVSAACGLSGLQFYLLPDQKSVLARWSRRLPADVIFGPIVDKLQKQGVIVRTSTGLDRLQIMNGGIRGAWLQSSVVPPPSTVPAPSVVLAEVDIATIPSTGFVQVQLPSVPVWVGRQGPGYLVLGSRCTHEGCSVDWQGNTGEFVCPCHGGRFGAQGDVLQGPPKTPLDRYQTRVQSQTLQILGDSGPPPEQCSEVILATDLDSAQRLVAQTDGLPTELRHNIGHLDTTPVIVIRLWFDPATVDCPSAESAVTPEFDFIDNFFRLNSFNEEISSEGLVIEGQAYRAAATLIDATDEAILSVALSDLCRIDQKFRRNNLTYYTINRHRALFTRYGPGQNEFRPAEGTGVEGLYFAGDWTQAPWSVWMMERGVVSGLRAANAVLAKRGLATVDILRLPQEGLLLRLSRALCLILRLAVLRRLPMGQPPTDEELMMHSEHDHAMSGWVALVAAVSLIVPLFSAQFSVLTKVWQFPFIAIGVYFFFHTEPDVRYQRGSWLRAWADNMTLQHRLMAFGSILAGLTELALIIWNRNGPFYRAFFPAGLIASGIIFYNHHHGDKVLIGRQHRIMAFAFVLTGLTALGSRFIPVLGPLQYVWPTLLGFEAYLYITYTEHDLSMATMDPGGHAHDHSAASIP